MTEKLYWNDMYLREFDATVQGIEGNGVILDQDSILRHRSGGSPMTPGY